MNRGLLSTGYIIDSERMCDIAAQSYSSRVESDSSDDETIISITNDANSCVPRHKYLYKESEENYLKLKAMYDVHNRKAYRASEVGVRRDDLRSITGVIEICPNWFCLIETLRTIDDVHGVISELKDSYGTSWTEKIQTYNIRMSLNEMCPMLQNLSITEHIEILSFYALCKNGMSHERCAQYFRT